MSRDMASFILNKFMHQLLIYSSNIRLRWTKMELYCIFDLYTALAILNDMLF